VFDQAQLKNAISQYKEAFAGRWDDERYKWEAVKHFQDSWNANAAEFAEAAPEEVRVSLAARQALSVSLKTEWPRLCRSAHRHPCAA
jgi:hypothetical protein